MSVGWLFAFDMSNRFRVTLICRRRRRNILAPCRESAIYSSRASPTRSSFQAVRAGEAFVILIAGETVLACEADSPRETSGTRETSQPLPNWPANIV